MFDIMGPGALVPEPSTWALFGMGVLRFMKETGLTHEQLANVGKIFSTDRVFCQRRARDIRVGRLSTQRDEA